MANWSQSKLIAAIGGGAVCICLAAGGGVYWASDLVAQIEADISQKEGSIAEADAKIAKIPGLEQDVIILRENLGEYVKILPDSKELTDFVRMVYQFEKQSGIKSTQMLGRGQREGKTTDRFTPIAFSYEMTATLWQCLKFINLIENYERFVSITDFSISAGGATRGEEMIDGDAVHTVKLTLQTYTYNATGGAKTVTIPDYENQRLALREEIWKRMQAIRIDRYEHRGQQGRRDILVDPRERGDLRPDGPSQEEQRKLLEKDAAEVARLRDMHLRLRKQDTTLFELYSLEKSLKEGLERLEAELDKDASRVSYAPYKLRWAKEVVTPLEDLHTQMVAVAKAQQGVVDPCLPAKDMEQLIADMESDCKSGMLEQAKTRYESVATRLDVPTKDPRHVLAVAAKGWHVKAATALDFKGLDLKVQGLVVNKGGKSGLLLNGEVYEEGDYVSDELLVKLVEEEQVWFVFRGLTLVRTM
jgi:Tfp pilus assembly protein PilO